MKCNLNDAINLLKSKDNILIITHKNPDGDAIVSSFGLYFTLLKMGKRAAVDIGERLPDIYNFIYHDYNNNYNFKPDFIVSVDLADITLLFDHLKVYKNKINLSIDHHPSNTFYAYNTLLDSNAASTTELLYDIVNMLLNRSNIDEKISSCLYLGLATDTGCFKYSSVTAKSHLVAADLFNLGADFIMINKKMFDTKSKKKLQMEQIVLSNIDYYFNGKCAVIFIPIDLQNKLAISDDELEGFSGLPIQIEGIMIGITIKEKKDEFKISIRTNENFNASDICKAFGGGGHKRAGGCTLKGNIISIKNQLLSTVSKFIEGDNYGSKN